MSTLRHRVSSFRHQTDFSRVSSPARVFLDMDGVMCDFIGGVLDLFPYETHRAGSGGKFSCYHNACAIQFLRQALTCLRQRTAEREARGVEGTHAA